MLDKKETTELATANANHEHFERQWYLRGDEIERLKEQNARMLEQHCHLLVFLRADLMEVAKKYEDRADQVTRLLPEPIPEHTALNIPDLVESSTQEPLK